MKLTKSLSFTVIVMAVCMAASVAASARDYKNVALQYDATVAGSHLRSGDYIVKWETHSPEATVSFMKENRKVVATAEGKIVDRGKRYPTNEVVYEESKDGARVIRELRFSGSSEVIEFNP